MPVVLTINHNDFLIESLTDATKVMAILEKAVGCNEALYDRRIHLNGPPAIGLKTVPAGTQYLDSKGEALGSQPSPFPGKRKARPRLAGPTVPSLIDRP